MSAATIAKPTAAAGGGGSAARLLRSTINWHRRGVVTVPHKLQGFDVGQVVDAYVCCLCGGVELTEYGWTINHGCCSSARPWCKGKAPATGGYIEHWSPRSPGILGMGQYGGLDVGDVVALPGQRQPMLVKSIDIKPSKPTVAILSDRHGNRIETDGSAVHQLDILARARRYPFFPSNALGVHLFMPLAGNLEECAQCGGGNHPYHAEAPNGPGRFVPIVAPPGVQPVPDPGNIEDYRELVAKGALIDMAGYPLYFVNCDCDRGKVRGMTCAIDVPCTTCGAKKGKKCVRPSEHEAADFHAARQAAAQADMNRREAAGDLTVPAPWPGKTKTKEAATVTAAKTTTTKKKPAAAAAPRIKWVSYKGAGAVPGNDIKPGEEIRCPVSGCDRRAKIRRDLKIASHKMYGAQTCHGYGEKIPDTVMVDVLSRAAAAAVEAASAQQETFDGMADLFGAMLAGQSTTAAVKATAKPDTTPLPVVYKAELMVAPPGQEKRQPGGAEVVRIDELAKLREEDNERVREYNALPVGDRKGGYQPGKGSWCIASEGEGIPPRHVWHLKPIDRPGCTAQDGTQMWELHTLIDGERGHGTGTYEVWGSEKVTIVPPGTGGFGPGMFSVDERAEVQLKHDGPWLRVVRITYGGVFVKGQKPIIAWSDIYHYRKWGNETHIRPAESALVHGTCDPVKNYGFDGGDHQFVAMFTGSLRCRVCLDSIRWKGHTGILNADFQGFEEIRQSLLRPTATWQARHNNAEWLDRYVRGLPLVRYDRDSDVMWNLVCPLGNLRSVDAPKCGGMHIGFRTRRAAKAWWFRHCAEHHAGDSKRDSWGKGWTPTWDDAEFPEEPGIVFDINKYAKHRRPTDPIPEPVAMTVPVPRCDPSWERLIAGFEAEGRGMTVAKNRDGREIMTIEFPEGQPAAASLRAALKDAGFSYSGMDMIRRPKAGTSLAELLAKTFDPKLVQLSTGTIRDPEKMMFDLDEASVRQLLELERAADGETAVIRGVIVHCGSGNAVPVGWFDGTREAKAWWNTDFNKFRADKDIVFMLLAPDSWENDYDLEQLEEPKPKPVTVVADTLPGLDDFMAAMATTAAPAASPLDEMMQALAGTITTGQPGPDATDGEQMLLTDVPLNSYIEVIDRLKETTRRGYLIELPRVHTAGWGERQEGDERDRPYLKYTLSVGSATVGMYSPVYIKVTVLPTPDAAPVLPEPKATRPICVSDLRPGDVVDKGGLKQKTRDGVVLVLGRPVLVSATEVRIRIRVGGHETSCRIERGNWTQLVDAAPFAKGDELPLAVESKLEERDLRALREECERILAAYNKPYGEAPSQALLLWAAGAMRLRSGYYFWRSWHSGDQMATYLPASKSGQGVGGGVWFECDKGGFTLYPHSPKDKADAKAMKQALQVSENGWDQVLPYFTKVPAHIRQLIEDLMADREACSPGRGYTEEHISPAPRDGESLNERSYRMSVDHDLFKAAMEAWVAVRPS